jgi:hypothetical protein
MVIILILHLVPCSDTFASPKNETAISQSSCDHQKSPDDCSPFCACYCCVTHTIVTETLEIRSLADPASSNYNEYVEGAYLNMAYSILQPPQLALLVSSTT